ncbi:DUF7017 domain-containing protein [Pseudomonas aeruginosa]|uniref:DUF7017 domain-containing protein n=1 Tax=Pseudomonas aeruginosa TaxID=287 RepID=UPI0005B9E413|nr:hypothetical protein [Pseudomonas aeruginosa]EIZ0544645.1 hypothetical protein [Pseudomonas aeruginosa]EKV4131779.1 hypothetical protein [Pseudomonas aeruginosa]EKW0412931.1 hypothetical protein [Pseudomonas aeruginosa]EKW1422088.1 hypothetical protein [Pseudomonas aeruginosa]EKW1536023.1 hypothetical protein [Pseudomonas aeruginosa]
MISNKEVFAKRREGAIDEAYKMALELMAAPQVDDWDRKAFAWCLIDLIKRDVKGGDLENLPHYRSQLEGVAVDPADDVLSKGVRHALSLCNPFGQQISEAKGLSKSGQHAQAAAIYRKVWMNGAADQEIQTSFGWELYQHTKALMAGENFNVGEVKRNLSDYLKLEIEKPSPLHSRILQLAAKLAGQEKLRMLAFSRHWNLQYLRGEDYERYRAEDGREFPSLAEKVIQQAGKEAAAADDADGQAYMLPFIDSAMGRFPDNVFLKLNKAKLLLALGRHDEAMAFGIAVTKAKSNDYWAWGLLGDIVSQKDPDAALGCYCKALTCPAEDKFTGKIRLEVAERMLEANEYAAAKHEVEAIVRAKEQEGYKIPDAVASIVAQGWFAAVQAKVSNRDYYRLHAKAAEALLFNDLPWIDACLGETFVVPGRENKPKRKVFLKTGSIPAEVSIPESKVARMSLAAGDAVRIKGEFDEKQRFNLFVLERRPGATAWDVAPELLGVVNQVNEDKQVIRYIVSREINGEIPMSVLPCAFAEGDAIEVQLVRYVSKRGSQYRVLSAKASEKVPGDLLRKDFTEAVRVSNGMGFTPSEIFIPPPLVERCEIEDGQQVSGTAVQVYNKKRESWGWKAVSIQP